MSVQGKKEKGWKNKQQLILPSERVLHGNVKVKTGSARILKSSYVGGESLSKKRKLKSQRGPHSNQDGLPKMSFCLSRAVKRKR